MTLWTIIHLLDFLLWLFVAASVVYVFFFALASLLPNRHKAAKAADAGLQATFLVLYPAYHEDTVIRNSVETFLQQDYPKDRYTLGVISDHMSDDTNRWLAQHPLRLFTPTFEKSTKAKALQYAIAEEERDERKAARGYEYDYVVILDADNVVQPDFLTRLNILCQQGHRAIQCHRCAKNSDNDIAVLDGVSEEINNTLFRRGHNRIGLSSALIGSGMCFDYAWFRNHVGLLHTAVEDRELEALLFHDHIFIHYEESLPVFDEKVSSKENFQRQRLRWMSGQVQSLLNMLPTLPHAIATGNINLIDKTMQLALIPRSILMVCLPILALLITLLHPLWSIKWWMLFMLLIVALFIAIPPQLRRHATLHLFLTVPRLVWLMLKNLFHMDTRHSEFIHTTHNT